MFLYRVKVEELDAVRLLTLKSDLTRGEDTLRAQCPILEMSLAAGGPAELDIYLALDDFIDSGQLQRLAGELNALIAADKKPSRAARVSSELIHI
jgi:hypothetical protein